MSTLHIEAQPGQIAKTVLMPGDPLRGKYIAYNFLENSVCVNSLRNNLGFTGFYKGKKISVFSSGMGCPSIGIYSYELYNFYGVENIIRIGTSGALSDELDLKDIVLAQAVCTDSNYLKQYNLPGNFAPIASYHLLDLACSEAKKMEKQVFVGNVLSSDIFYSACCDVYTRWKKMGVLAVEMESCALYSNAALLKKNALCILTITDHLFKECHLTPLEREKELNDMIGLALNTALLC